jgi:hypothetical protein
MADEPIVRAQLVLRALNEVQKDAGVSVLQRLERQEPDLAEFVLERLTDVQHQLWAAGVSDADSRRVYPRVQELVLTAIEATRFGQAELLEGLSPSEDEPGDEQATDDDEPGNDASTEGNADEQ